MLRFFLLFLFFQFINSANGQNKLPATYLFDEPPTAIFAQTIFNDTIVCVGTVFKEGDTIHFQQGAFIAFIDSCGNLIHYRKYFDAQGRDMYLNLSNKIIRTKDGGYCFLGSTGFQNLLIKTDGKGDSIFIREYPFPSGFLYSSFQSIHEINNALYVVGYGGTDMPIEDDLFMYKFDQEGNQLDYWRFQTPENCEYFQDAIVKGSNIVISVSQTNACVSAFIKSKTKIFEVDTSGNLIWSWVDSGNNFKRGWGLGLKCTPDGGWIYGGAYSDTIIGTWEYNTLFVTKIDSNRTHEWTRTLGFPDNNEYNFFKDIAIDAQGDYIITGQYSTGHPDFPDSNPAVSAIVTKISQSGEILWNNIVKAYENGPVNGLLMFTNNVNLLSSGNIIIGGYLYRFLPFDLQNEGWLAKLSPNGEVLDDPDPLCGFVSVKQPMAEIVNGIHCYPNPADNFIAFDLNGLPFEIRSGQISIYDLTGKTIEQKVIATYTDNIVVDTRNLADGIYLYRVVLGQKLIGSGKFIVSKS
ncbi:MAG: T9SS type A sorting domain-containing protein [Leadbetterella sp.]|nr:T9SS type A sorting domain-containing protein [Leadbetterella sp.]